MQYVCMYVCMSTFLPNASDNTMQHSRGLRYNQEHIPSHLFIHSFNSGFIQFLTVCSIDFLQTRQYKSGKRSYVNSMHLCLVVL